MATNSQMPTMAESQRNWRRVVREFGDESNRGAALVAAALLDLNLEDLLRTFMIDDPVEVEYLLGSGLQSYGARIRVAYALGLVSDDEANDLRVIQSVRNYFAHNLHVTFEAEVVQVQLERLRLLRQVLPEARRLSPRRQLEQAACMLSAVLVQRLQDVAAIRRQRRPEQDIVEMASQCQLLNDDAQSDE